MYKIILPLLFGSASAFKEKSTMVLEFFKFDNKQNLLDYISKYIYVNSMERNPAFIHRVVTEFKNKEIHDRAVKIGLFRYYKLI